MIVGPSFRLGGVNVREYGFESEHKDPKELTSR
jgi:hypothetical protein